MLENLYREVTDYVFSSGKRLLAKAGKVKDIGITKTDLTEEDLAIERELKKIVGKKGHTLFAEEENFDFTENENIWVVDPISGTHTYLKGLPHYGVVASHIFRSEVIFAVVYDPSVNELFTAKKGLGSFLNGKKIHVSENSQSSCSLIFNRSLAWYGKKLVDEIWPVLNSFGSVYRNTNSFAVNYCQVACGRFDGVFSLTKDPFPEYAGSLILREAGGNFTNSKGEVDFLNTDRIFVGGNPAVYKGLFELTAPLTAI